MIGRFETLVLAFVLLAPPAAQAQVQGDDITLEFGLTRFTTGAADDVGGYVGFALAHGRVEWLEPYFALNDFSRNPWFGAEDDATRLMHGGANLRLGPATWRARPVARVGVGFFKHGETTEFTGVTGGAGLYLRMRSRLFGLLTSGVSFTADFWSVDETTFVVAHAGLYFRIG